MSPAIVKLLVVVGALAALSLLALFHVWVLTKLGLDVSGRLSVLRKTKSFVARLEAFGAALMIVGMPLVFVYFAICIAKDIPGVLALVLDK